MDEKVLEAWTQRPIEIVVVTIAVILTGSYLWRTWSSRSRNRTKLHLPPGPRGLPLLGSLLSVGKFPYLGFIKLSQKYGPLIFMRMGSIPVLVVCNTDMIKEVLQKNDHVFASRPPLSILTILTYGGSDMAAAPYGPHFRHTRKICTSQLLTASKLSHFSGIIEREIMETIRLVLKGSESGNAVNVTNLFNGMTMNVVTQMMWGRRHRNINSGIHRQGTDGFQELVGTFNALVGAQNLADFLPSFAPLITKLSGLERRAKASLEELDDFIEQIIHEREEQLFKKTETTNEDDFLDVLLNLANQSTEDSERLSREAMKGLLVDMLIGGTDTTSVSLDWALAELMRHPEVMRKAELELNSVVGPDRLVKPDDIPKLEYIGAIVKEILRRRGPGPMTTPHFSSADCKVGGYDVPANTMVFINAYAVHHDPALWEKPMDFNPDRFLHSDVDFRGRHFQFLPFSSGRRICPGINFASDVLHLGLAQMLHTVKWSLPAGQTRENLDMSEKYGLVLSRAKPLFLIGKPRVKQDLIMSS